MALCVGVANAQYLYENDNEIGMYMTADPTADNAQDMAQYSGTPGTFTAYIVLTHPMNLHYGDPSSTERMPISAVGGFEFNLTAPASAYVLSATLPPLTTNFATPPDYLCGSNTPVINDHCTLLTLNIGAFTGTPDFFYLSPVKGLAQSIPNSMAITDYNDYFRLNPAFPVTGDYNVPVFGLWQTVVPTDDAAWGEVKSLYR
jgi:hypothetical protein